MEKIGRAPRVHQFAIGIDADPHLRVNEIDVLWIVARQLAGNFRIGAHGISAKHFAILMDGPSDILQNGLGPQFRSLA
jgi:hypothetical protein